jgi:hypothetical protein
MKRMMTEYPSQPTVTDIVNKAVKCGAEDLPQSLADKILRERRWRLGACQTERRRRFTSLLFLRTFLPVRVDMGSETVFQGRLIFLGIGVFHDMENYTIHFGS